MVEKTKEDSISFKEIKEVVELIIRDEDARDEFVSGVKEVIKAEKNLLIMMAAGILMIFFGIFGILGLFSFLTGLVLFGVKIARFTLSENEGFMDLFYKNEEDEFY